MGIFKPYRFYTKAQIEYRANQLLRQMKQRGSQFVPQWPLDPTLVADFLDLGVVWDAIAADEEGAIAARILPLERCIEINEEILEMPQGFQESTLAHEIGHWLLHVDLEAAESTSQKSHLPFVCRGNRELREGISPNLTQLQSIEWQAQYFASCLLMPRHILEDMRQGRNLTEWAELYAMREQLGVSISNLVNRLQDLEWIYIPKRSRQIYPGKAFVYG
ncbi:ImmA/IrrE family metallo-endopeptidase [Oxynema sp. CENA135]|uniref:ImmA/IrrE family metallo-endopeptidase n=1 Tax=Oxynema sp. CENA135 TaxID=984206 RepID=UPI00190B84BB|nr:ImmA/IrrE family metallo-endopeptidase [Oxynema sp. CENA135]MBK4732356.1 ImmA/IrrE family metallo-endopeptidase [Oxynema sp. CENA135]